MNKGWRQSALLVANELRRGGLGVIHDHALPQVLAIGDELLVNGMDLISVLSGDIVEEQEFRDAVAAIDDAALLGIGRHADVDASHGVDAGQRAQTGEQLGKILLGIRILQPEEHVVHDRREQCLVGGHGRSRAGAGGNHAGSQSGGGNDDISARAIGHDPGPSVHGLRD